MKPSFSFSEMCTLISMADCATDVKTIRYVLDSERYRYPVNELGTLNKLLFIREGRLSAL